MSVEMPGASMLHVHAASLFVDELLYGDRRIEVRTPPVGLLASARGGVRR